MTVPANTYEGVDEIKTYGVRATVVTSAALDDQGQAAAGGEGNGEAREHRGAGGDRGGGGLRRAGAALDAHHEIAPLAVELGLGAGAGRRIAEGQRRQGLGRVWQAPFVPTRRLPAPGWRGRAGNGGSDR